MRQILRLSCTATFAVIVAGCATYEPRPLDPRAELEALRSHDLRHFVVERAKTGDDPVARNEPFDPTDGLSEAEVVAVALTLNPELIARRAAVGEAEATLIAAGLWPNPEIGVSVRPGIDGASGYALEADALLELLRPRERDARKKAADARVDEVRAEIAADEFRFVGEVRQQRLAVFAAERAVAILVEAVELRQRTADVVRRLREIGDATELTEAAAELELAEARRDVRQAQAELESERRELNRLMGLPPDYDLALSGFGEPLRIALYDEIADEELDQRLLAGRLELRATEAAYRRADQGLRLAVLRQFPRLAVGPAFERELEGDQSLGLGLSLELPLLNRNQGEIAERRAARERVRAEYVAMLHRLRADAFAAREAVRVARTEVEAQERDVLPLLQRNQALFEGAFRAGELNIIDWITAQQRAVVTRREYLEALVRYRRAIIGLETALGRPMTGTTTAPSTQASLPSHEKEVAHDRRSTDSQLDSR